MPYICHIYQFKAANVRCLFFSVELSVGKVRAPIPGGEPLLLFLGRLFLRLKKKHSMYGGKYILYIYILYM